MARSATLAHITCVSASGIVMDWCFCLHHMRLYTQTDYGGVGVNGDCFEGAGVIATRLGMS